MNDRQTLGRRRIKVTAFLLVLVGLGSACEDRPEGWIPALEETSTAFLEAETGRVLERVRTAREEFSVDPERAESALLEAETSLEHLVVYYLPLFQARERAHNAYRSLFLNDKGRVVQELSKIEGLLEGMAGSATGPRLHELQSLAEVLADARLAVESGPEEAQFALEALARELNQAAVKGELILRQ